MVGFALGTVIEKPHSAWTYGWLLWLGADPDAGKRGIGSRLFARVQQLFIEQGARMMLVDTAADNDRAVEFFRKQGFGHEQPHVFLHKNLDEAREALQERRKRKRKRTPKPPPSSRTLSLDHENED